MSDEVLQLDPKRSALVIQDMQNDVIIEGGAFADSGAPAHAIAQNAVANVADLAAACRAAGVPVIHVWISTGPHRSFALSYSSGLGLRLRLGLRIPVGFRRGLPILQGCLALLLLAQFFFLLGLLQPIALPALETVIRPKGHRHTPRVRQARAAGGIIPAGRAIS